MHRRIVPRGLMRHVALAAAVFFTGALPASVRADGEGFFDRLFHHDLEVITVTDMSPAGRALRQPSRKNPAYYEALILGYNDFGRSIAGENPPDKKTMVKLIVKLLADRGYYPATGKHPPEMLLALAWGTMNSKLGMAMAFMGGEKLDIMWELEGLSLANTVNVMTRFRQPPIAQFIKEVAEGPLYVISIQAFDEAEAINGRTKLLWHTKVACPSIGLDMTPTLQEMARQAAPYFGRELDRPVHVTKPPAEGHVDFGEFKILEQIDPNRLPITDTSRGSDAIGVNRRAGPPAKH